MSAPWVRKPLTLLGFPNERIYTGESSVMETETVLVIPTNLGCITIFNGISGYHIRWHNRIITSVRDYAEHVTNAKHWEEKIIARRVQDILSVIGVVYQELQDQPIP